MGRNSSTGLELGLRQAGRQKDSGRQERLEWGAEERSSL